MSYRIEFLSSAQREFLKLPASDRRRIGAKIEALSANPRPPGCVKLSGVDNIWRIRMGMYRVLYSVDDAVTRAGPQGRQSPGYLPRAVANCD